MVVKDYPLLNGGEYSGDWDEENHVPHGRGIYEGPRGLYYEGGFKMGAFHGWGIMKDNQKKYCYEGQFENGVKSGYGAITCDNGNYFEGLFSNNSVNDIGFQSYSDGEKHLGEYKNNVANGQGTVYFPNGNIFTGFFKDDKEDGEGIVTEANNFVYAIKVDCHLGDIKVIGKVKLTCDINTHFVYRIIKNNGAAYYGQIDHYGLMVGKGIFHYPKESLLKVFIGEFNEDFKRGRLYFRNGDIYEGFFENDELTGIGKYIYANGDYYDGEFVEGLPDGDGVYQFLDGREEKRKYVRGNLLEIIEITKQ